MYMACIALVFVIYPEPVLWMFSIQNPEILRITKNMLRFCACFMLFDGLFIVYTNAIKAAGDTLFAMIAGTSLALVMQAAPSIVLGYYKVNVWILWSCLVFYVVTAGTVFYLRYRSGKWTTMKVIEDEAMNKDPVKEELQS